MSGEANQQETAVQEKKQMQWMGQSTDLSSFTAFGVVKLSDGQRVNVQMTNRHGLTPERMYADYKDYVKFLDLCAQDHDVEFWDGSRSNGDSKTPASVANKNDSEPSSGSGGSKRNYKDPVPQAELPAELAEVTVDIWAAEFDSFEILPKPDEKSSINFIKDGLQYPVGSINKWKRAAIKEFLASLTENEINPAEAKVHRIAGVLYWKQGNPYMKDGVEKHYKDVVLVKPAF